MSGRAASVQALLQPLRQLRKPRELYRTYPEAEIMAQDSRWHKIARYDSALVTLPALFDTTTSNCAPLSATVVGVSA